MCRSRAALVRFVYTLLPVLLIASVLVVMTPEQARASAINLTATLERSGTSPFDAAAGPGNDTTDTDAIVRTHDFADYRVTYSTSGGDANARLVLVLPTGDVAPEVGSPVAVWEFLPPTCTAASTISADGQTITCELGNVANPQSQAVDFRARVLGAAPNGTTIPMDGTRGSSIVFESDDQPALAPAVAPVTAEVSAAPGTTRRRPRPAQPQRRLVRWRSVVRAGLDSWALLRWCSCWRVAGWLLCSAAWAPTVRARPPTLLVPLGPRQAAVCTP